MKWRYILWTFYELKISKFSINEAFKKIIEVKGVGIFIFEFVPLRLGFTPSCNNPKSSFSSPVLHASNNLQSWCIRTVLPVRLFFFSIEFSEKKNVKRLKCGYLRISQWECRRSKERKLEGHFWNLPSIKLYLSTSSFRTFFAFSRRSGSMKTCHRSFSWYDSGSEIQIQFHWNI